MNPGHGFDVRRCITQRQQRLPVLALEMGREHDPGAGRQRYQQGHEVQMPVDGDLVCLGHGFDAVEHQHVDQRHDQRAGDDGHPTEGLHGRVHQPLLILAQRLAKFINAWHRLHGHGVGHHVLDDIADRSEQYAEHIPAPGRQDGFHRGTIVEQAQHDQQAGGYQPGAEDDQTGLVAPDEIDQMTHGQFERPGQHCPEGQSGQEFGRKPQVILDEEGADNRCQPGDASGQVHHQRRQVAQADFPAQFDEVAVDPALKPDDEGFGVRVGRK